MTMKERSFALIGHPLGHSISPQIHNKLFSISGIRAQYKLMEIAPDEFGARAEELKKLDGFNVTIPYKQKIIPYLYQISKRAARCGAVNTVKNENGLLFGYNTDSIGFLRALENAGIALKGKVLLCGTGGAARMMACEALERGCELCVAARGIQKADALKSDLIKTFPEARITTQILADACGSFDLILNATPVGMYPNIDGCPAPRRVIEQCAAAFDAVYNPLESVFVKTARAAGATVAGGLSMLLWQAAAAQEIWTGVRFDAEKINAMCGEMSELIKKLYKLPEV